MWRVEGSFAEEMFEQDDSRLSDSPNENEQCSSTLVDEIEMKYLCDDAVDSSIFVDSLMAMSPSKMASEGTLELLVLNHKHIDRIGDAPKLLSFARNVSEMDLAWNNVTNWKEVAVLLELKRLRVLNLSYNPLDQAVDTVLPVATKLQTLILNNTNVQLAAIRSLISKMPALSELYLSGNSNIESEVAGDSRELISDQIRVLFLNFCGIAKWDTVLHLRQMFPSVTVLFLSGNLIKSTLPRPKADEVDPLDGVCNLSLNKCQIDDWESVERLAQISSLHVLRMQQIPLLTRYSSDERIHLVVGRMPHIEELNGSSISEAQRIESERFFIRYYDLHEVKPEIYAALIARHGHLEQLCNLDLTPKSHANVVVLCEETGYKATLRVRLTQSVSSFMRTLEKATNIPVHRMRCFYFRPVNGGVQIPEELRFPSQKLCALRIEDGDQFCVQSKIITARKKSAVKK